MALSYFISSALVFLSTKCFPLLFSLIAFGLMVVIHEFGHFLFCKLFSIRTPTFSIGFGPKLIERTYGDTNFCLSAIPLGGYVEIAGLSEIGQGDQAHAHDRGDTSFSSKPWWQRTLVLLGGIIFNMVSAYLAFCLIFLIGSESKHPGINVSATIKGSAAEKAGLLAGDKIIGVDHILLDLKEPASIVAFQRKLLNHLRSNPNNMVTLHLVRKGQPYEVNAQLDAETEGDAQYGRLGAAFIPDIQRLPFFQAFKTAFEETNKYIVSIAHAYTSMFKRKSLDGAGGPVMIFAQGFKSAQSGLIPLLIFFAFMSINLALFNLLPLGITDGGQLLFTTIEAIIRRPLPMGLRIGINIVSFVCFIGLALYLTLKDILTLCGDTLKAFGVKVKMLGMKLLGFFTN